MIPNDFGIIRQADHNLFALLFKTCTDISECNYEIVMPEYVQGGYYTTNGSIASNINYANAIVDISEYDYVIIPCTSIGPGAFSGIRDSADTSSPLDIKGYVTGITAENTVMSAYFCFENKNKSHLYALISVRKDDANLPLIGFKRHRSDHVNPLGIIQPLDPGMLRPQVKDPDIEEEALEDN